MLSKTHFWDAMMRNEFLTENCICGTERCLLNRRFQNPGIVKLFYELMLISLFLPKFLVGIEKFCCTFIQRPVLILFQSSLKWGSVKSCVPMCPLVSQGISVWLIIVWCEPMLCPHTDDIVQAGAVSPSFDPVHICLIDFSQLVANCPAEKNGLPRFVAIQFQLRNLSAVMCSSSQSSCQVSHCLTWRWQTLGAIKSS